LLGFFSEMFEYIAKRQYIQRASLYSDINHRLKLYRLISLILCLPEERHDMSLKGDNILRFWIFCWKLGMEGTQAIHYYNKWKNPFWKSRTCPSLAEDGTQIYITPHLLMQIGAI
jgi:hypothetical protein